MGAWITVGWPEWWPTTHEPIIQCRVGECGWIGVADFGIAHDFARGHLLDAHGIPTATFPADAPFWEDDGTACTPCRDCPGCHAVKPARAPGAGVESPNASEAVRSPHSTSQTPSSTQGEPA